MAGLYYVTPPECDTVEKLAAALPGLIDPADSEPSRCDLNSRQHLPGDGHLWIYRDAERVESIPRLELTGATNWLPIMDRPGCFIGWNHDWQPTPDDLRRSFTPAGYTITLADGHDWYLGVPDTLPPPATQPPRRWTLHSGRAALQSPPTTPDASESQSEYARWLAYCLERVPFTDPVPEGDAYEILKRVGTALSRNYRITWEMAVLLGLFDEDNLLTALSLTTDPLRIQAEFQRIGAAQPAAAEAAL